MFYSGKKINFSCHARYWNELFKYPWVYITIISSIELLGVCSQVYCFQLKYVFTCKCVFIIPIMQQYFTLNFVI